MAVILYSNAILETLRPAGLVFTEDEIINVFSESYHTMHSKRLIEISNTWAVWASMDNPPSNEYNMLGSDIVDFDIDSPLVLIHDSELNPAWNVTDDVLQFGYDTFLRKISEYVNDVANETMKERETSDDQPHSLISLVQMGITPDKKLLFSFDPNSQDSEFYEGKTFATFSQKILDYMKNNLAANMAAKNPFTIFDDNKTVVIVNDEDITATLDVMMDRFAKDENYEACKELMGLRTLIYGEPPAPEKKKRSRRKKDDKNNAGF